MTVFKTFRRWLSRQQPMPLAKAAIVLNDVMRGDVDAVQRWLNEGVSPNVMNSQRTALHCAAESGNEAMVNLLLQNGADPWSLNVLGKPPIESALTGRHVNVVHRLLATDPHWTQRRWDGENIIGWAIREGDARWVRYALDTDPTIKAGDWKNGWTLLHDVVRAASKADLKDMAEYATMFDDMLKRCGSDALNVVNVDNVAPLHTAMLCRDTTMVRRLVEAGADVHRSDGTGRTPLHHAVDRNWEALRVMVAHGADVNHRENDDGDTPLHDAVRKSHSACVRWLLENGADPDLQNKHGNTVFDMMVVSQETRQVLNDYQGRVREKARLIEVSDQTVPTAVNVHRSHRL